MSFHLKPVPISSVIFLHTHTLLCRVAYGAAPVDSRNGKSGGKIMKGRGKGGKRAKKYVGNNKEREKIEKLRVWRKTKWSCLGADIFPRPEQEKGRVVILRPPITSDNDANQWNKEDGESIIIIRRILVASNLHRR
jgi:hypothetical protein